MAIFTDMGTQEVQGDFNIDPNESVANQHPDYMSGGRRVTWNGTRYVYADAGQYGGSSDTDWSGAQSAGGGGGVSGGTSGGGGGGGGGGGSTDIATIARELQQLMGGGGSSMVYQNQNQGTPAVPGIDSEQVLARMDRLFSDLTTRASQRADAAMANYRGATDSANQYLQETFAQGLSQRMVDEFSGRLRSAQAARGLAFGGAPAQEEAALLTGIAEKRRETLLPTILQNAQTEAALPATLEGAFMGVGAQAAQASSQQGAVVTDALRAAIGQPGSVQAPVYSSLFSKLFG